MHENCLWIHFGIPRGTSSRAHGICLGQFEHGPPPLRNQPYPDRPPHLTSSNDLLPVRSAKRLCRFMMVLILKLPPNKIWTVENPLRSWLWATSYVKVAKNKIKTFLGRFDMCMFGGRRFKKTGILTNSKHVMTFQ